MKVCYRCKVAKPLELLKKDKNNSTGRACICKECHNADHRKARIRNPEKFRAISRKLRAEHPDIVRAYQRKHRLKGYSGLSVEDYQIKLDKQNSVCAICKQPETAMNLKIGKPYPLCVDHSHTTNLVRDLLCRKCNLAVDHVRESKEIAKNLLLYVTKWEGK